MSQNERQGIEGAGGEAGRVEIPSAGRVGTLTEHFEQMAHWQRRALAWTCSERWKPRVIPERRPMLRNEPSSASVHGSELWPFAVYRHLLPLG